MPKWKEWPLSWHWSLDFVPRTSCSLLVARKLFCFICQSSALKSRCLPATVCRGRCSFVWKPVTHAVFIERAVKSDLMVGPCWWGHKVCPVEKLIPSAVLCTVEFQCPTIVITKPHSLNGKCWGNSGHHCRVNTKAWLWSRATNVLIVGTETCGLFTVITLMVTATFEQLSS